MNRRKVQNKLQIDSLGNSSIKSEIYSQDKPKQTTHSTPPLINANCYVVVKASSQRNFSTLVSILSVDLTDTQFLAQKQCKEVAAQTLFV